MTVRITATAEPGFAPPRVRLDVVDDTGQVAAVRLLRGDPDGVDREVRVPGGGTLGLTTSGVTRVGTTYDYAVPLGEPVTYIADHAAAVRSAAVTVTGDRVWLVPAGDPSRAVPLLITGPAEVVHDVAEAVFAPLGRATPVVVTDGQRKAPTSMLPLRTTTLAGRAALLAAVADASPLWLGVPAGKGWGTPSSWVAVGALREARTVPVGADPHREWSATYRVVDLPAGGVLPVWSLGDARAAYPTLAAARAAFPTFAAARTGPA